MEFKIGDRFLHSGEEVTVVGNLRGGNDIVFVRRKDNTIFAPPKSDLKPIVPPLKEGQEVWVKSQVITAEDNAPRVKYPYNAGERWCDESYIYIKNSEGQIVPFKGE